MFGRGPLSSPIEGQCECFHIDDQFSSIVAWALHLFFIAKFFLNGRFIVDTASRCLHKTQYCANLPLFTFRSLVNELLIEFQFELVFVIPPVL